MRVEAIPSFDEKFFEPALRLVRDYSRLARPDAGGLDDEFFVRLGLQRALDGDESGRCFLQTLGDNGRPLARSTWFDAFQSQRRLAVVAEMSEASYAHFEKQLAGRDWLGEFGELKDRAVWAFDGHQIEHACHAQRDGKGRAVPAGLIYGMCLHSGLMRPIDWFQGDGERHHEWPVFKGRLPSVLARDRRKCLPIAVVDPAFIDILHWSQLKRLKQAVFISREKENMKPEIIAHNPFNPQDPVNRGVLADEMAGYSCAYLRRIRYRDPETGEERIFITTDPWLRPGLVALLYLTRWKIEKAYDVFKNKLFVRKAWGNGKISLLQQGHFLTLLHNLLTLLLNELEQNGISETKVLRRQSGLRPDTPSRRMLRHVHIHTAQFIRAVRNLIACDSPWIDALALLRVRLECYL